MQARLGMEGCSAGGLVQGPIGKDESEGVHALGMRFADEAVKQPRPRTLRGCENGSLSPL